MKKILTKLLLSIIDKDLFFEHCAKKQEIKAQGILNKKILDKFDDLEKYSNDNFKRLSNSLRSLDIIFQNSYTPKQQFCLISFINLKGEKDIIISDLSKLNKSEINEISEKLRKSTNITISNL